MAAAWEASEILVQIRTPKCVASGDVQCRARHERGHARGSRKSASSSHASASEEKRSTILVRRADMRTELRGCPGVSALASSVPSRSTPGHFGPLQPLGALAAPRERPRPAPDEYRLGSAGFGRFSACHTLPARPRGLGPRIILSVFKDAISIVGARSPLILRAAPRSSMPCAHLVDRGIG